MDNAPNIDDTAHKAKLPRRITSPPIFFSVQKAQFFLASVPVLLLPDSRYCIFHIDCILQIMCLGLYRKGSMHPALFP